MYKVGRKFIVTLAGTAMPEQSTNSARQLSLSDMHWAGCVRSIENALRQVDGVEQAQMNLATRTASVSGNADIETMIRAVQAACYDAQAVRDNDGGGESQAQSEQTHYRRLLRNTVLALALGMPLMVFSMMVPHVDLGWTPLRGLWLAVGLATLAVLTIRRWAFFRGAGKVLRVHSAAMDTLIALGAGTAWLYST
jgi:P-type Cu+ transporter